MPSLKALRPGGHHSPSKRPLRILNGPKYLDARRTRFELGGWLPTHVLHRWHARTSGPRGRGAVDLYSDATIALLLAIKVAYGLSYSGVLGLVRDHFRTRGVTLPLPDESTLCRRAQRLGATTGRPCLGGLLWTLPRRRGVRGVVIDSTGLAVRGPGTWRSLRPHGREEDVGRRREWLKLHLAVDPESGEILAYALTPQKTDDGRVGVALLRALHAAGYRLRTLAADGAYDTKGVYAAAVESGISRVLVPPKHGAGVWAETGPEAVAGAAIRNAHWAVITLGAGTDEGRRAAWKRDQGYGIRSLVETAMCRSAVRSGNRCRMRSALGRQAEVTALITVLNRHARLGMPVRYQRAWADTWPALPAVAA